ncbi:hypothetical protein KIL84_001390 [Mauremys mutica]|uniref:Uncharacterized protein n=1 Tax=Mauremys mutica TaxID=74926 RepID=A0A9D3X0M8_9SAUR|nr:hypothetical protein KIL84_001390 [Mauremys mutica]
MKSLLSLEAGDFENNTGEEKDLLWTLEDSDSGHAAIRRNWRSSQSTLPLTLSVQHRKNAGAEMQTNGPHLQEFSSLRCMECMVTHRGIHTETRTQRRNKIFL